MTKDPAMLIGKVIQSNLPVYREGEKMIKILNDLIDGIQLFPFNSDSPARQLQISRMYARVYGVIVDASLYDHNDFAIAHETCLQKLSPLASTFPEDPTISDVTWKSLFKTGTFSVHQKFSTRSSSRMSTTSESNLDSQKMDLLARGILICPKSEIDKILQHWIALESKMLQPSLQPQVIAKPSDHGNFLLAAAHVGRNIVRSASPSIGGHGRNGSVEMERSSTGEGSWGTSSSRFGVRDTVKSGLTQGLGWLLGATAQEGEDQSGYNSK
jgi:Secretory pathway protein Sec39